MDQEEFEYREDDARLREQTGFGFVDHERADEDREREEGRGAYDYDGLGYENERAW